MTLRVTLEGNPPPDGPLTNVDEINIAISELTATILEAVPTTNIVRTNTRKHLPYSIRITLGYYR